MRPSKNAFTGYTYQEQITFLFLVMMDVERKFKSLDIEADVNHNFDDVRILSEGNLVFCQIKDFDKIALNDLEISKNEIFIKGRKHKLSDSGFNVLVFKKIDIEPNFKFLGLSALKTDDLYIISISRIEADEVIDKLYESNQIRKIIIDKFFKKCLDNRVLSIKREDLPIIKVFDTKLLEETINVGKRHLEFSNILHIEGKPGVGKSHYVNTLSSIYKNSFVYRFWLSNQDKDYKARLIYSNFISDISKKLFNDYVYRNEIEIISKIKSNKQLFILDGLDHVENYNNTDLKHFVEFLNKLALECKVIVLSRPLKFNVSWKKQILTNWNEEETRKVLNELYHIEKYTICSNIYNITDGYPILVRFIGEHFKTFKNVPNIEKLKGIEDYYDQILINVNTKTALTLFLTSQSFFMVSELNLFLSDELFDCLNEFIAAYPYLFEKRLNRISLFHDSLNKYLKEQNINFSKRKESVNNLVYNSLARKEKRFMSRFSFFDLEVEMKLEVIKQFSSIKVFKEIAKDCIDFEALRAFYTQIREALNDVPHSELEVINYYDLSLIINIVIRDHISTQNQFLYTYSKCLFYNGYTTEDVTSSEYLFGMFNYIIENDPSLLYNITSDSLYSTTRFLEGLKKDVYTEKQFFLKHAKPVKLNNSIDYYLKDDFNWREYLTHILTNLYIYKTSDESLLELQNCIDTFINVDENEGIRTLEIILHRQSSERRYPHWVLNDVKKNLLALGRLPEKNPYLNLNLKNYVKEYSSIGSFDMSVNILNYLRLSLEKEIKIDIESIGLFWCMYYRRKDYTVINMHVALKVFEENGLIDEETAIKRVVFTQNMSEKGIRHLLADYISIHSPSIINKVIKYFDLDDLNIIWFNLLPKHISAFPERVFNYAVNTLWKHNRFNKEVDFKDIANVFYSSRWEELLDDLKFFKYKIRISKDAEELKKLKKCAITILPYEEDGHKSNSSDYRYKHGMLDSRDKELIIGKNLSVVEVSGYLNGNYAALEDLDIFKLYSTDTVAKNLKHILYNATLGKINSINSFGSLYYFVGNLPKLVDTYDEESNIKELFESFVIFLELSMLNNEIIN
ncbi:NACHT domain-containing protein [Arenibacter algicola]|uniref:NACHT domain protein n=1 Tax=Arenibacter algicola TaxID=616991 RepID=A0A221UXS4_9FLAO|nr:hypothetical protein [Arenibacter algicola]ASO06043.1 hypothetical protein AREALGSMS7_02600 [Arenibacter algicola]|tara:strand:+ start:5805 stop:9044 length:3240 start_codon:yes stop_codon:yes gene_type:complete